MKRNLIKIISLLLAAVMLVLAFAACGKEEEPIATKKRNSSDKTVKTEATEPAPGTEPGPGTAEPPKTDAPATDAPKTDAPKTDAPVTDAPIDPSGFVPGKTTFDFEGAVIESNDSFTFAVNGIDFDKDWNEYLILFSFENKTDEELMLSSDAISFNGYAIDNGGLYENVEPKSTAAFRYGVLVSEFEQYKLSGLDLIEFMYSVKDNDYNTLSYSKAEICPTGIDPASFKAPDRLHVDGEAVVRENAELEVVFLSLTKEEFFDNYAILFYVENRTDKIKHISVNGLTVNNWDIGSSDYLVLMPGHGGYLDVYVYRSTIDEIGFKNELVGSSVLLGGLIDVYTLPEFEDGMIYTWNHEIKVDGTEPEIPDCPFRSEGKVVLEAPYELIVNIEPEELNTSYCPIKVYFSNGKDRDLHLVLDGVKVNGTEVYASIFSTTLPGVRSIDVSGLYYYVLRDLGITNITSVEFKVDVSDDFIGSVAKKTFVIETNIPVPEE